MTNDNTQWVLTLSCIDGPGIVHAISGAIVAAGGNIAESQQFASADTGRFFMRLQVEIANVPSGSASVGQNSDSVTGTATTPENFEARFRESLAPVTERYDMNWRLDRVGRPVRTLILASTATHCVNDLLYRRRAGQLPIEVPLVLSNHETVRDIAEFYGVPFEYKPVTGAEEKAAFEARVLEAVEQHDIELVVLARYMQILSPELCEALEGKAINIHHSFLPGFKGANPYKQAHERGVKLIGATAHFVTTDLDEGPIIEQDTTRVDHAYTPRELVQLGQDIEARVLRHAVNWFAENRVLADGDRTIIFR
ncbi:formyltetrahydrofolate deformylase [Leucobacter denitrificans]|uniref:Formyltetrahydrofolate deformylase n=1 Tax=Leucobacter denitrificans TaxID=683042 RepID=A0A7G9S7U5_9MICO|nr:formyltetrahydrofolate deformylase [Leucobacter denitrificans]